METKEILMIKSESGYNVLRKAADCIAKSFRQSGYEVTIVDIVNMEKQEEYNEVCQLILDKPYKLIFSFQALFFNMEYEEDDSILNYCNSPIVGWIVDHPIYHYRRLECTNNPNIHLISVAKEHVECVERYFKSKKQLHFLPHGGFTVANVKPYKEKEIDLFFSGGYTPISEITAEFEEFPEVFQNIIWGVIGVLLKDKTISLHRALVQYLQDIKFEYEEEDIGELLKIVANSDKYIRAYYRDIMIRVILENGIKLTVAGRGWNKLDSSLKKNLFILGEEGLNIEETLDIMNQSKIVLNSVPTFKAGMHERIFSTMNVGSVCLTDSDIYRRELLTDQENVVFYEIDHLEELPEIIHNILDHEENAERIARNGYEFSIANHTWEKRAEEILRWCCERLPLP